MNKIKKLSHHTTNLKLFLAFIMFAILTEVATFMAMGFGFLPQYFLMNLAIIFIIACIPLLIPSAWVQAILYTGILATQAFLSYLNVTLYNIFGSVININMVNLISEAGKAVEDSMLNLYLMILFIVIIVSFIAYNFIVIQRSKYKQPLKARYSLALAVFLIVAQVIGFGGYNVQVAALGLNNTGGIIGDDAYLHETLLFESEGLRKFGTYTFYFKDLDKTFSFAKDEEKQEIVNNVKNYIDSGTLSANGAYTGVSAGNNVIVIMMESMEYMGIDPVLTPTLYSLTTDHVAMNNYYAKSKTNISEAFGIMGSYPLSQPFSSVLPGTPDISQNNFDHSLPNVLKENGYENANYFIFHEKDFYNRINTHLNFGFDNIYDLSDFDVKDNTIDFWGDWPLDSEMIKASLDVIAPVQENPFFTFMTTMITHGPYNDNYRFEEYYEMQENAGWVNPFEGEKDELHFKHYMAAAMDLDRGIATLIADLESKGIADETTIVMYSDHNAYYYDMGIKYKGLNTDEFYDPQIYNLPFMIYDQNLPPMQIDEFTCPYDIMPTVLDLLGLNYNENLYMGNSVVNENNQTELFMAIIGGIMNSELYSINGTEIIRLNGEVTEEEKQQFVEALEELVEQAVILNDMYIYNVYGEDELE